MPMYYVHYSQKLKSSELITEPFRIQIFSVCVSENFFKARVATDITPPILSASPSLLAFQRKNPAAINL